MPARHVRNILLTVDNEFGVLTRITALVRREGFNILSLAVAVTENPEVSRMVMAVECVDGAFDRVLGRLRRLGCVRRADEMSPAVDMNGALGRLLSQWDFPGEETAHV